MPKRSSGFTGEVLDCCGTDEKTCAQVVEVLHKRYGHTVPREWLVTQIGQRLNLAVKDGRLFKSDTAPYSYAKMPT